MGKFNNLVYFGDEINSINEVSNCRYVSEEMEIIGVNYTRERLAIALRRLSGKGLSYEFEDEKVIKKFCWDTGVYYFAGSIKDIDFQKLKGKKVKGFVRELKGSSRNSGRDYIGAISPIDGNFEIISKICENEYQKVLEKLENSGNNLKDLKLKYPIRKIFDEMMLELRLDNRFRRSDINYFNYWNLN